MERKRIEKLVVLLLIGILLPVSLFPFRINADTITNNNVNINYYLESVTPTTNDNYMQTYRVDFVFDQSYLGWISSRMVCTYINNNTIPVTTSQFTKTQAIYVNGSIASTSFTIVTSNTQNGGAIQSISQSIQNSNVTPLADLSTLDDILNVLTDINNNIEIDVIDELQNIVANTSLANEYLELLTKMRQYNFPIESLSFISQFAHLEFNDLFSKYSYSYPVYDLNNSNSFRSLWMSPNYRDNIVIFGINKNIYDISTFNIYFDVPNIKIESITPLFRNDYLNQFTIVKIIFDINNGNYVSFTPKQNIKFIPIYLNYIVYNNLSTDFALTFGLSNNFLDNIQIIANGTNQSNSASGSLDQATSQFSDDTNDLVTIEESFNNSMNQSLQSVNPTFNMGSSFLTSANWVSQQFNRIVNNTPFASLITFGLTLGLGLLIIGKVRK